MSDERHTLLWQYGLVARRMGSEVSQLTDEECLWLPTSDAWTVRLGDDGLWRADWPVPPPRPIPSKSIAWLLWCLIWEWSSLIAEAKGAPRPQRETVLWPGSAFAAKVRLDNLWSEWTKFLWSLRKADLERPISYGGPVSSPLRLEIAHMSIEMMEYVARIRGIRARFHALSRGATTAPTKKRRRGAPPT